MTPEVEAERKRCAMLCDDLASRWEKRAEITRAEGSYTVRRWLFGKKVVRVTPAYEQAASYLEAAASGLRMVQSGIIKGWGEGEKS